MRTGGQYEREPGGRGREGGRVSKTTMQPRLLVPEGTGYRFCCSCGVEIKLNLRDAIWLESETKVTWIVRCARCDTESEALLVAWIRDTKTTEPEAAE
jgi:hypothetical protein